MTWLPPGRSTSTITLHARLGSHARRSATRNGARLRRLPAAHQRKHFGFGAGVQRLEDRLSATRISQTQEHDMKGRPIAHRRHARSSTRRKPNFGRVQARPILSTPRRSWTEVRSTRGPAVGHGHRPQHAAPAATPALVACQAENNIPVGRQGAGRAAAARCTGSASTATSSGDDEDNPQVAFQPHRLPALRRTRPARTCARSTPPSHSPEGLNDMAYNRCIGTRYCANNCPYKVRRFNFFNYDRPVTPSTAPAWSVQPGRHACACAA